MIYKNIALKDFIAGFSYFVDESSLDIFAKSIQTMIDDAPSDNSEEFQKKIISDFLRDNFNYKCNVRGKADLAIYDEGIAKVLFEVKSTENKTEFVKSPQSLESKAFYESILYFLREVHKSKNNNIKHIILCTAQEFYVIKAKDYHKLFIANADKAIQKRINTAYKNCDLNQGNDTSTRKFYNEIEAIMREMGDTLEFCYINIEAILVSKDLSLFYALLSPNSLLQIPRYIDANTLNEKFYNELLYILGLKQVEISGKVLIKPNSTPNALLDCITQAFSDKLPSDIDEAFESHIFPLLMLWNNRILFLRLLESMLLNFKHIEKPFLHIEVLSDFGALNTLFFKVLAIKERTEIPQNLSNIPYLNSSLFEKSELESQGFEIPLLESKPLKIAPNSILRSDSAQNALYKAHDSLPFLEYLFAFLHAYNFTTTAKDIVDFAKTNHDRLINSAVLGLVFEKLNGYKEGSFYTPSFITGYMCAQSIRKIVVQKFNENGYKAQNLTALRNEIDINKLNEANKIFLSIRICDPAVGSGHFLVSALNELIAIKHELGLLLDTQGKRLRDIDLSLENDELIIKDFSGKIIDYTIPAHERIESHIIQKALFHTKKELIEHCLFGVDINPSSVEICKLRLWIELLKYSYYENITTRELQTLPNIDINIKCGNSLISNFTLDSQFTKTQTKEFMQNLKITISDYKAQVALYKEALTNKRTITDKIRTLKTLLQNYLIQNSSESKRLIEFLRQFVVEYGESYFDIDTTFGLEMLRIIRQKGHEKVAFRFQPTMEQLEPKDLDKTGEDLLEKIKAEFTALESLRKGDSFEWRFEFPEVLNENGDFMGFDLVIGNPPYGNLNKKENKDFIEAKYPNSYFGEISSNFAELAHNLIKNRAHFGFVTSYALTFSLAQSGLRNLLQSNYKNIQISSYDRDGFPQFEKMSQSVCILFADSKWANQRAIFQTSNFVRQKITHDELEFSPIDNLLLIGDELGDDFSQRHRIPKIGGDANLKLLKQMQKMPNKLGNLFDGNESLYIRTSGNYWYNAFLEIPYQSTEIKSFSVKNKYFVFCLINSNVYYWWLRIYGDGRHNNKDIMDSFRLPKIEIIEKHNDLWEKLALNHWDKMKSVFNTKNNFFATSQIKDCVDILDYHICLKVLGFDKKTLKYICNYDKNIRGGLKCNFRKLEAELKAK